MAEVRLGLQEANHGDLPPVCIYCGTPALVQLSRQFTWQPRYLQAVAVAPFLVVLLLTIVYSAVDIGLLLLILFIALLSYFFVARLVRKHCTVLVPVCAVHQHRQRFPKGLVSISLIVFLVLLFVGNGLEALYKDLIAKRGSIDLTPLLFLLLLLLRVALLVVKLYRLHTSIHALEITEHGIALTGVAEPFAAAIYQQGLAKATSPFVPEDSLRAPTTSQ
jgi:hypothetical protein